MLSRRRFLVASTAMLAMPTAVHAEVRLPARDAVRTLAGLPGIDGPALAEADIEDRPVLVTFWASWCPPCRNEFAHFNRIQDLYAGKGLLVVGVNVHEDFGGRSSPEQRARFIEQTAPRFRLIEGDGETLSTFGDVRGVPAVFLFDRNGEVTYLFVAEDGPSQTHVTYGDLRPALERLF
jgi:cytochrome c biogenesis protein CcmG/thiol:disulfide interchange protein DsbE